MGVAGVGSAPGDEAISRGESGFASGGSMLTETQKHRAVMIRKMIEHHRSLARKPIFPGHQQFELLLTAAAVAVGAGVILFDPIFQGLAISLLFGLASSTLLTVLVIPAIYRVFKT